MRQMKAALCAVVLLGITSLATVAVAKEDKQITLAAIGRYDARSVVTDIERAEIAAYDPATKRIFSINPTLFRVDVLDISDPTGRGTVGYEHERTSPRGNPALPDYYSYLSFEISWKLSRMGTRRLAVKKVSI